MNPHPTGRAAGPYDAAFLPRCRMALRAAGQPAIEPVAKLGGAPCWLSDPTWPLDPDSGEPLVFVGQFLVPGSDKRLAYLFLHEDDRIWGGIGTEDGDAVLLIQPGGRIPSHAVIGPPGTRGRSLWRWGPDETEVPVEWYVDLVPAPEDEADQAPEEYVGGVADYAHHAQIDAPWQFFFRLTDCGEAEDDPYFLNFGYGYGYAFLSPDGGEGRFFWESC
ncbi:hypothetical protein LE181_01805 [Streptomyces sp. SCA3-4]|uniref:hypothetical protein n=1 Tax=Streptomyces sichuanensis TaxID=2871810 RepID=UPI001CE284F5|nr:hypothetical protein [Streptomyces sichuanensis]MCA6090915.1 hypothetical protein [Streptomyces sichuanensis]